MPSTSIRALAAGLAVLALAACSGSRPSRSAFQADVQDTRNVVDSALARITKAQSRQELVTRMDDAAHVTDGAADHLDGTGAAKGFGDDAGRLVDALHQLATDLSSTADAIRRPDFQRLLSGAKGLSFPSWDRTNRILGDLRARGIAVEPLRRH